MNKLKYLAIPFFSVIVLAATLFGQGTSAYAASGCGQNVQCVITFGNQRIADRLTRLSALLTKVQADKYITPAQAQPIENDVNLNINGLKQLQVKLDNETTIAAARADVKNIYEQYRIFAVVLPLDYHELWMDHLINLNSKLVAAEPALQTLIQNEANKGVNVSQEQAELADFTSKVTDMGNQLNSAEAIVPQITPAGFPGTTALLKTFHTDLQQAHQDAVAAHNDFMAILTGFGLK